MRARARAHTHSGQERKPLGIEKGDRHVLAVSNKARLLRFRLREIFIVRRVTVAVLPVIRRDECRYGQTKHRLALKWSRFFSPRFSSAAPFPTAGESVSLAIITPGLPDSVLSLSIFWTKLSRYRHPANFSSVLLLRYIILGLHSVFYFFLRCHFRFSTENDVYEVERKREEK